MLVHGNIVRPLEAPQVSGKVIFDLWCAHPAANVINRCIEDVRRSLYGLQIKSAPLSPVWLLGPREQRSKSWPGRLAGLRYK